jgi:hypothetical protein
MHAAVMVASSSAMYCLPGAKIWDKWRQPLTPLALSGILKMGLVVLAGRMGAGIDGMTHPTCTFTHIVY